MGPDAGVADAVVHDLILDLQAEVAEPAGGQAARLPALGGSGPLARHVRRRLPVVVGVDPGFGGMIVVPGVPLPAHARSTMRWRSIAQLRAWRKATSFNAGVPGSRGEPHRDTGPLARGLPQIPSCGTRSPRVLPPLPGGQRRDRLARAPPYEAAAGSLGRGGRPQSKPGASEGPYFARSSRA